MAIDFRGALNTISDVVQNRPVPLREFDQIYMKVGDLVIHADFIARNFNKQNIISIGDGDAICLSMMHLKQKKVLPWGPKHILVLDFDERIVNSINHFARKNSLASKIKARLYNVCDPLPKNCRHAFDAFYTNPPWGASNEGASVLAFVKRGLEAIKHKGRAAVVIADEKALPWTGQVLHATQNEFIKSGFIISEMIPHLHKYHLDDTPDLPSCCLLARDINPALIARKSEPLAAKDLENFYGRKSPLKYRYVRDCSGLNRGKAADCSYKLVGLRGKS